MRWRGVLTIYALILALSPIFLSVKPVKAASASYFFSPSNIKLNVGQSATVTLYLSTDTAINAGDGTVVLPSTYVNGGTTSKSGSIFTNWPEEPGLSGSSIRFAGGLPTPGYQGSSGKVLSFSIKGTSEGTGLITVSGGRILANNANSTNIFSGAPTATVTVTRVVSGATITSTTHPDPAKWYQAKDANLTWTKPSGATSYSYTLSHDGTEPSKTGSGAATSASFTGLADGVWTFSLVTSFSDGKTANSSYTIRVDTTPPAAFVATVKQLSDTDPFPILSFITTDEKSGIDRYEISVDGVVVATTTDNSLKLPRQTPGTHSYTVKAFDKAGNSTESSGTFTVTGFPGPTITDYPKLVSVLQPITITGRAMYGTTIKLFVDGKVAGEFLVKDNLTSNQKSIINPTEMKAEDEVEWTYTLRGAYLPGKHSIYAIQAKEDTSESERSNEVVVRVLTSSIQVGGVIIPILVLIPILIIILILLAFLFVMMWRRSRNKDKSWSGRVRDAEKIIDQKIESLQRTVVVDIDSIKSRKVAEERIERDIHSSKDEIDVILDDVIEGKDPE